MSSSDAGTKSALEGTFVTCARCGAGVELPAKYCDMCGGRITQPSPADLGRSSAPAAERREQRPVQLDSVVSEQRRDTARVDPEIARRSLTSAYRTVKGIEKTIDSIETPADDGNIARRALNRITSRRRMRVQMENLRRILGLARQEASKAADLDLNAAIETEDGPLNVRALSALVDRVQGTIEFLAGKPRAAVQHYESSIATLETRDAYLDMALAYERIGQPGKALCAYEKCSALVSDGEVDAFAEDEADRLRSRMIMGGWFVGSWIIAATLAYLAVLSLLSLLIFPFTGKAALAMFWGGLGVYLWANFRRPVISAGKERGPSEAKPS